MVPLLVALFVAISGVGSKDAQPASATLELQPYFRELRTVRVSIGQETFVFLFDTGAGVTAITPQTARKLGCTPYGQDIGFRMSGERVAFGRCGRMALRSGGWSATVDPVGVFDLAAVLPPELPQLDGILGLDAFRGHLITIDWPARKITVDNSPGANTSTGPILQTRIASGESGRFLTVFVPVAAAKGDLWLLLDSGNIAGTLVARSVVDEGLLQPAADGTVRLALRGRSPMVMPITTSDLIIDGALGTAFLSLGPITVDLRRW